MISVILPVYNEEKVLEGTVRQIERILSKIPEKTEIIISEDGSTDKTVEIAKKLESPRIRLLSSKKRLGKGASIIRSAKFATGDIIIFMDADLASEPRFLEKLISPIKEGADIVVASRYLKGSKTSRDFWRHAASKCFNFLVRLLLGSKISDHQCGFKAFRRKEAVGIFEKIEDQKWFFDAEFLVRAQREGLKIKEIPIEWKEAGASKFNLLRDGFNMAVSLYKFKLKHL